MLIEGFCSACFCLHGMRWVGTVERSVAFRGLYCDECCSAQQIMVRPWAGTPWRYASRAWSDIPLILCGNMLCSRVLE